MKININYDLLEKITLSKNGFSIKKTTKKCLAIAGIVEVTATFTIITALGYLPEGFLEGSMLGLTYSTLFNASGDILISNIVKQNSIADLKKLSIVLKCMNINTNHELLLNAYEYQTKYDLVTGNDKIPRLEQKKYIMVPVYDNGEEKEMSLLQEHIIGTKTYTLSCGEPDKVLKLRPILT